MNRFLFRVSAIVFFFNFSLLHAQDVSVIKAKQLEDWLNESQPHHRIVNFWATWCKPCIKELPYFENITKKYASDEIQVTLVSLDFVEQLETRVKPFLEKKQIKSEVVLLDETDFNAIINNIHPDWSGAIPATLVIPANQPKRTLYEKEFHEHELESIIQQIQ
jgi:thiol-disulfide isomerase/thioredoxin